MVLNSDIQARHKLLPRGGTLYRGPESCVTYCARSPELLLQASQTRQGNPQPPSPNQSYFFHPSFLDAPTKRSAHWLDHFYQDAGSRKARRRYRSLVPNPEIWTSSRLLWRSPQGPSHRYLQTFVHGFPLPEAQPEDCCVSSWVLLVCSIISKLNNIFPRSVYSILLLKKPLSNSGTNFNQWCFSLMVIFQFLTCLNKFIAC